uniref:Uncharacterized protein n=1 Tax=Anguilla anguilla TaxID=7936 RepID=A0A0E9P5L8_ANGAN
MPLLECKSNAFDAFMSVRTLTAELKTSLCFSTTVVSETSGKDTARAKLLTRAMKQCMVREKCPF